MTIINNHKTTITIDNKGETKSSKQLFKLNIEYIYVYTITKTEIYALVSYTVNSIHSASFLSFLFSCFFFSFYRYSYCFLFFCFFFFSFFLVFRLFSGSFLLRRHNNDRVARHVIRRGDRWCYFSMRKKCENTRM